MMNIKVTFNQYDDLQPNSTLVNGEKPNPILTKVNGIEYFVAKAGMILTVSDERAKYLVEERKLAEYVEVVNNNNDDDSQNDKEEDEVVDNNEDNKQEDEDNNDDESKESKENILINNDELETADKKIDNLEKAVKKTTRKR